MELISDETTTKAAKKLLISDVTFSRDINFGFGGFRSAILKSGSIQYREY